MSLSLGLGLLSVRDPIDNLIFTAKKNLEAFDGGEVLWNVVVELEALVEELIKALALDLENVTFHSDDNKLYRDYRKIEPKYTSSAFSKAAIKTSSLKPLASQNALVGDASESTSSTNLHKDSSNATNVTVSGPFTLIDEKHEITDASPTTEDGLQLQDQIVKIDDNFLQKLASEAQTNQDCALLIL
ncbi:hypothetical protein M0R45_027263 [Rubus argutus]|uniref:Uncharacterized protein n=1 Tax=Rubus argutus TaxID=59490 RepID=A0AAW1X1P4_RUBAR